MRAFLTVKASGTWQREPRKEKWSSSDDVPVLMAKRARVDETA